MKYKYFGLFSLVNLIVLILFVSVIYSCETNSEYALEEPQEITHNYKTKNVVIIIADGLRYTESWGHKEKLYIPKIADFFSKEGVVGTNFYNMGDTYTSSGHSNMITGFYQIIENSGLQIPYYPSIFQYFNKLRKREEINSWIIASKDKLEVLGNCTYPTYMNKFLPLLDVGVDGKGLNSGYRNDSLTLKAAINIFNKNKPNLVLINFQNPDEAGHTGDWNKYTEGIKLTDKYIYDICKYLNSNEFYRNNTTVFITSDHGRHSDGVFDGFMSHGCNCVGCRHISFFAYGPDFKNRVIVDKARQQIDLAVTAAYLLGFNIPDSEGKLMIELFEGAN